MANNRIQIYCTKDLEYHSIFKYYPGTWFPCGREEDLNLFFEKHNDCHEPTFDGLGQFAFRSEADDDGLITCQEGRLERKV